MAQQLLIKKAEISWGVNLLEPEADESLDLRNFLGPVGLLEVTNVFRELLPNQILEIIVGDFDIKGELFRVLKAFPYEIVRIDENEGFCRILLKKGAKNHSQ